MRNLVVQPGDLIEVRPPASMVGSTMPPVGAEFTLHVTQDAPAPVPVLAPPSFAFTSHRFTDANLLADMPTGVAVGDLLLAWVIADDNQGALSAPSGWTTELAGPPKALWDGAVALFSKIADGSEGASVNVPMVSSHNFAMAQIVRVPGVSTVTVGTLVDQSGPANPLTVVSTAAGASGLGLWFVGVHNLGSLGVDPPPTVTGAELLGYGEEYGNGGATYRLAVLYGTASPGDGSRITTQANQDARNCDLWTLPVVVA